MPMCVEAANQEDEDKTEKEMGVIECTRAVHTVPDPMGLVTQTFDKLGCHLH